jgi:hypothetical protein
MPNEKENFFAKKDEVSSFIEDNIKYSIKTIEKTFPIEKCIDSADLTRCPRYIFYKASRGVSNQLEKLFKGYIIEKWKNIFQINKRFDVLSDKYSCSDIKYNLVGSLDLIIRDTNNPRKPFAIKVHHVEQEEFKTIKEGKVPRKDIIELMANMWMAEIANGILIYENKNFFEFEIYHISPDTILINSIKTVCKDINKYNITREFPARPYETISTECEKCVFKASCWLEKKND